LKEQLPEYMVPTIFVALERLPLTPNGKLDRLALPAPDGESAEEHVAPRTAVEAVLTKIWCELLGFERISIYSNFFEVGGHSLLVMQMISRVRETFKTEMPLYRLFQASTIAGLAQVRVQYEAKPGQMEMIARLRQKLDSMSEDEMRAMLEAKKKAGV
jgi:acyl carrier protein